MDVKLCWTMLRHWSQLVPNVSRHLRTLSITAYLKLGRQFATKPLIFSFDFGLVCLLVNNNNNNKTAATTTKQNKTKKKKVLVVFVGWITWRCWTESLFLCLAWQLSFWYWGRSYLSVPNQCTVYQSDSDVAVICHLSMVHAVICQVMTPQSLHR